MDACARDGLDRLNATLPLAARQCSLPAAWREAHRAILVGWARAGRPPTIAELAAMAGSAGVAPLLARLAGDDMIVRDAAGEIVGAYPFTTEQTPHVVTLGDVTVRAMCAVDALAMAPMLGRSSTIASRCGQGGDAVTVAMAGAQVTARSHPDLQVGIHWQTVRGHTAHSLCRQMLFLAGPARARAWTEAAPGERLTYTLDQARDLGAAFFVPLLA